MSENFLILNSYLTEMLAIDLAQQRHHFDVSDVSLDNYVISHRSAVKNLGVTIDSTLSCDRHIKEITKIAFFTSCHNSYMSPFYWPGHASVDAAWPPAFPGESSLADYG